MIHNLLLTCLTVFLILSNISVNLAQSLPASRTVDWSKAGLTDTTRPSYSVINVTGFGAQGDGTTINNAAVQAAISSASGNPAVIFFPGGTYFFNASVNIPSNIVIRGDSVSTTLLQFNLAGTTADLFKINGSQSTLEVPLQQDALKNNTFLILQNSGNYSSGMYIKVFLDDDTLVSSSWALNSVAQIVKIVSVSNDTLFLESPLRRDFPTSANSRVKRIIPKQMGGFECFKIERLDSTAGQSSNFNFDAAVNCWIKGVESAYTNYAHVAVSNSSNIVISGNYFHHSFGYGGGGRAYGVVLQFSSGEVLVENNIFRNLRHSMILQAGANGNVFAYNYSLTPFWTEGSFPANSAGEIVLHGNYVYANLFEGNVCQNIVIDDSHGINGPYNTFLRNRANGYGLIMNSNPASNSQNIVGNEIPNTGPFMGNFMINGTDHFIYGNVVRGNLTPAGTNGIFADSYYLNAAPFFFGNMSLPAIGPPHAYTTGTIPAIDNYNSGNYANCKDMQSGTDKINSSEEFIKVYPNPSTGKFLITFSDNGVADLEIIDIQGRQVYSLTTVKSTTMIETDYLREGIYFIRLKGSGFTKVLKLVILQG